MQRSERLRQRRTAVPRSFSPPRVAAGDVRSQDPSQKVEVSVELQREVNFLVLHHLSLIPAVASLVPALHAALEHSAQLPMQYTWDGHSTAASCASLAALLPPEHLVGLLHNSLAGSSSLLDARLLRETGGGGPIGRIESFVQQLRRQQTSGSGVARLGVQPPFLPGRFARLFSAQGHRDAVYCCVFDRSGTRLVSGSDDALVKIWSTDTGFLLATLRGHEAEISDLAVSPDNTLLASGSNDACVRVWNLDDGSPRALLAGHTDAISALAFAPLSCLSSSLPVLVSASLDGSVRLWAVVSFHASFTPPPLRVLNLVPAPVPAPAPAPLILCAALSTAAQLACGASDGRVRLWALKEAAEGGAASVQELVGHSAAVTCLAFAHHSEALLSGSADATARLWLPDPRAPRGRRELVLHARASPPSSSSTTAPRPPRKTRLALTFVCWMADDAYVACALSDGAIQVWSAAGELLRVLEGHERESYVLVPHPSHSHLLLSASYDARVCLWDVLTGTLLRELSPSGAHSACLLDGHFAPSGLAFALSDSTGVVHLYGTEAPARYDAAPREQFLAHDYSPLLRDAHGGLLDAEAQLPPHLLPRAPLCTRSLTPHLNLRRPSASLPPLSAAEMLHAQLVAEARTRQSGPLQSQAPLARPRPLARHAESDASLSAASGDEDDDDEGGESWSEAQEEDEDEDEDGDADNDVEDKEEKRSRGGFSRSLRRVRPARQEEREKRTKEEAQVEGAEEDQHEAVSALPRWLSGATHERNTYAPQPEDEVVYIRGAHQRFLTAAELPDASLLDVVLDGAVMCVLHVEYLLVRRAPPLPLLRVARLSLGLGVGGALHSVDVAHVGEADFLVLRSDYDAALRIPWTRGMRVGVYYAGCGLAEGVVVEHTPAAANEAIGATFWESLVVRWDADGDCGRVSPWEAELVQHGASTSPPRPPQWLASRALRGALLSVLATAMAEPRFASFVAAVSPRRFPAYRSIVCAPVHLRLIHARLHHLWYRSSAALLADVSRIAENCRLFNGPTHPLAALADALVAQLDTAIRALLASPLHDELPLAAAAQAGELPPSMSLRLKRRRPQVSDTDENISSSPPSSSPPSPLPSIGTIRRSDRLGLRLQTVPRTRPSLRRSSRPRHAVPQSDNE